MTHVPCACGSMCPLESELVFQKLKCKTIGFSGQDGKEMKEICDITIEIPSKDTPRIQEMHIVIGHTICHLIDQEFQN